MEHQLAPLERPVERVLGGHAVEDLDPHRLAERLGPGAATPLGLVHGGLRIGQELGGVVDPEGVQGHTHRGVQEDLAPFDHERLGQR